MIRVVYYKQLYTMNLYFLERGPLRRIFKRKNVMSRCLYCMREYDGQYDICPFCGSEKDMDAKELYFLTPGVLLANRYQIGVSIGSGGFGTTYKAWDLTLSKVVAIKEHYPAGLVNRVVGENEIIVYSGRREKEFMAGKRRFMEEARNMAKYNTHANIVNVYDFFEANNTAYIVMEYLDGENYGEYLEKQDGKRVSVQEALRVMEAVLTALSEIHKSGILHRDISPSNIFLCRDGRIKLIDFGAARFSSKDEIKDVTVILKPGYAPPEQYQSRGRQGPWIDIYAAGATLYRAVTGVAPEESVNRDEMDCLMPPEELCPEMSHKLNNAILRAMAVQPELRFQSAEEFKDALFKEASVRDVERELKKRKLLRLASITVISAALLIGILICTRVVDRKKEAAAILDPVEISIWASADSGETAERKQEMMEEALRSFREEYPHVAVTVTCIEEALYEARLREAMRQGRLPTLFDSSCLCQDDYEYLADVSEVFRFIEKTDYFFMDKYEELFPNKRQLPMAFSLPAVYYCTIANEADRGVEELVEEGDFLVTSGGFMTWYNLYSHEDPVSVTGNWPEAGNLRERISDGAEFLQLRTACLLADTSRYVWVQENMPGIYEMELLGKRGAVGALRDYYSIDEDASGAEKAAAVQVLVYLLADPAQDVQYVQNGRDLPLKKSVFEAYTEINREFEELGADVEETAMAGEYQAQLDRWLQDMDTKE